jgi:hypothetical protein
LLLLGVAAVQVQANQRDAAWDSYTNILGFSVMGIWQKDSDGTDINAVCRWVGAAAAPAAAGEQHRRCSVGHSMSWGLCFYVPVFCQGAVHCVDLL